MSGRFLKSTIIPLLTAALVLMPLLAVDARPVPSGGAGDAHTDCSGRACCEGHSATSSATCCRNTVATDSCELPPSEPCESDCGRCPCCSSATAPVVYLTSSATVVEGMVQTAPVAMGSDRLTSRRDEPLLPPPIA